MSREQGRVARAAGRPWLRRGVLPVSLLLASAACPASDLAPTVDALVVQGYEHPEIATAALRRLEARTPLSVDDRRTVLFGLGMVAADSHWPAETARVVAQLNALARDAGPIANADAHLAQAALDFEGLHEESGSAEAKAAMSGYAAFCQSGDAALATRCDRFHWYYALLFAAYGAHSERNPAAAAIYLHMALDAGIEARDRSLQAKACSVLAVVAQADDDRTLADLMMRQAGTLAASLGDAATTAYVTSSQGEMLAAREDIPASRDAYARAVALSHVAGLSRREAEGELKLASAELGLKRPAAAMAAIGRARPFLAARGTPGLDRELMHVETLALLASGRLSEARARMETVLARYDAETGPGARIAALREFGAALAEVGDRPGALRLFQREQLLLRAKNDGHYEREMQEVQKLIEDETTRVQSRRLMQGGIAVVACMLVAIGVGVVARRQAARNRLLARRNDALRRQAEHDPLTGLANRAHLDSHVAMQADGAFSGAMLLVDVDHFKAINDRHGHAAGDLVLVEIARRLRDAVRDDDLVARWGGEEFLVLVAGMPQPEADALALRVLASIASSPVDADGRRIAVSASIGYAVFPMAGGVAGHGFDQAFALVDGAMYWSKNHGRNCATAFLGIHEGVDPTPAGALAQAAADGRAVLRTHRVETGAGAARAARA